MNERWRERAAEFRQLAASIRDPSIVRALERAARAYEAIAEQAEEVSRRNARADADRGTDRDDAPT
jgi:hypothetical protein